MASDFAPVQPLYLNLGQILGQAEDIKSSRMQQQMYQQRMQAMQQEQARMDQLRGLYSGGRNPQPQELAAVSPEYAQQAQRLQIDNMNAENGRIGEIQKVTKEAAINALKMWENTGRAPDAWPAILGETGRQLQSLGIRHPNGHLVGEEIDPNKVTPQMIMQIAGWEDPNIAMQRNAQAEAMKAGARVNAEQGARMPYDVAKEERAQAGKMQLEGFKLDNKPPPAPRQMNELQQAQLSKINAENTEKARQRQLDHDDAIANIEDAADELERAKAIQGRTDTGPIVGSSLGVAARKAFGDKDIQRLEKAYNKAAIKALSAFKAGGATFGALSEKEGAWVKSTQATVDADKEVNLDVINEGLDLLRKRKERIQKAFGGAAPAMPQGGAQSGVKVRRSNRTGAVQHSMDGGTTWVDGEP